MFHGSLVPSYKLRKVIIFLNRPNVFPIVFFLFGLFFAGFCTFLRFLYIFQDAPKTQKVIETSIAFAPIEKIDFENKVLPAKLGLPAKWYGWLFDMFLGNFR